MKDLRKQIISSLSKVQCFDVDALGEHVIEEEADKLVALFSAKEKELVERVGKTTAKDVDPNIDKIESRANALLYAGGIHAGLNYVLSLLKGERKE